MFVFSFKMSKFKLLAVCVSILVAVLLITNISNKNDLIETKGKSQKSNQIATTSKERLDFLKSFGWEVSEEALEVVDIAIPTSFNDVYENYNNVQKKQGYDLSKYRGKKVKRWTYSVKNYPREQNVVANLLISDDIIIGGDISSKKIDGFMHGFNQKEIQKQ